MNNIEFEKEVLINKCFERNIQLSNIKNHLTIKEYMKKFCDDLILDLKLIASYFNKKVKNIFKKILLFSYERKLKKPRVRMNYKTKEIELYDNKKYQSTILATFNIKY